VPLAVSVQLIICRQNWWFIAACCKAASNHLICENDWTDRRPVWSDDSCGPKKYCIRWRCPSRTARGRESRQPLPNYFSHALVVVFVMTEMGASDTDVGNHEPATTSDSWSRVNGWSWPPHPFQLIAWAVLVFIALFFYLVTIPALVFHIQIACYAVSLLLVFLMRKCTFQECCLVSVYIP